jgi:hypothetical protein
VAHRRVPQLPITQPTLVRRFGLLGESLRFETNDPALLASAEVSFGRFPVPADDVDSLVIGLFRESGPDDPPDSTGSVAHDPETVFRTRGNTFLISGAGHDLATVDLDVGRALGYLSPATVADPGYVRYSFIEAMGLSMVQRTRGYVALHAAGVVRDGFGVAILGPAGAGKSTVTVACARRGIGVLAEDVVFARIGPAGLELWGLPWTQRVLVDARRLFPELAEHQPRRQPNGEMKIEIDLDVVYPGTAVPTAAAGALVLLERGTGGPSRLEALDPVDHQLEILWAWEGGWRAEHDRVAALLGRVPAYRLRVNGSPDEAVRLLDELLMGHPVSGPVAERA